MNHGASRYRRAVNAFSLWVVYNPIRALLVSVLTLLVLGYGCCFLAFNSDYRAFFGKDNPQLQAFNEFQSVYGQGDLTVFAIAAKSAAPNSVFEPRILDAARRLTKEAWALPYAMRVDSVTNYQHTEANGDDLKVEALLPERVAITPARIAHVRSIALSEPQLIKRLMAPDGSMLLVTVSTSMLQGSFTGLPDHIKAARALRDRLLADYPELTVSMTGNNLVGISFPEATIKDSMTLIPLMYAVIFAILYLMLRSWIATVTTALVIAFSSIAAMGIAGYMDIMLTPPSMLAPLIITTLAVADSVHICVAMFVLMRAGKDRLEALAESVASNFTPIMLTGFTTAVGFWTINFTDSPPLHDLGNITAVGVIFASIWAVLLLPALLSVVKVRIPAQSSNRMEGLMGGLGEWVVRHRHKVLGSILAVALVLSVGIFRNHPNDNLFHYFGKSTPFRSDTDNVLRHGVAAGMFAEYSISTGESNGITNPAVLKKIDAFAQWWRTQPEVVYVGSVTDLFKRLNKNMHGDDPAWSRLPEAREQAAQYLLLYEMSLPFGLDLNNQINVDRSAARMTVIFDGINASELLQILKRGEEWRKKNSPDFKVSVTSPPVLFANISERNIASMVPQAGVMFFVMAFILVFALRSVKFGLLSLAALALPVGIAFGIWGFINGDISLTMAVLIGVVTGICDDDTIHFLNEYLHFRREKNLDPTEALRRTFHSSGVALLVTTAVLVAGFMVMTLSAFLPNNSMALLASISFIAALILNLLLLPPLIMLFDREGNMETKTAGAADTFIPVP